MFEEQINPTLLFNCESWIRLNKHILAQDISHAKNMNSKSNCTTGWRYDAHEMEDSTEETNNDQQNDQQRSYEYRAIQNERIMKIEGLSQM